MIVTVWGKHPHFPLALRLLTDNRSIATESEQ